MGIWNWQSNIENDKRTLLFVEPWLRKSVGGGGGALLCHTNTMLKRVESLQNIKIPPAVLSCNIHVDESFESVPVRPGSERVGPGRGEDFTPLLAGDTDSQPSFCLLHQGSRGRRRRLQSGIRRCWNSLVSHVLSPRYITFHEEEKKRDSSKKH